MQKSDTSSLLFCRIMEQVPMEGWNPLCLRGSNGHLSPRFCSMQCCLTSMGVMQKCSVFCEPGFLFCRFTLFSDSNKFWKTEVLEISMNIHFHMLSMVI